MGFESWHAQDDGEPIYMMPGHKRTVYLLDDKGNVWREDDYQGYGSFGGKDFYQLVAEMNADEFPPPPCDSTEQHEMDDSLRSHGIDIMWGGRAYKSPNLVHEIDGWRWRAAAPEQHADQGSCDDDEY